MKFIQKVSIIISIVMFYVTANAQASVTISGIDDVTVAYYEGVSTPSNGIANFSVTNDFTNTASVTNIVIQSVSMIHVSNSAGWTCEYEEMSGEPYVEGETTCTPNALLEIAPSVTVDDILNVTFQYESFTDGVNGPNALSLNVTVNATSVESGELVLGDNEWTLTVTEDATIPVEDPKTTSKVKGYIYFDDNNNDKRDDNEQGVEGIKIKLYYAGPNGKFDTNDDEKYTDKTNEQGKYHFNDLAEGKYRLKIEDGQMIEFYLTSEKDTINGKSNFSLDEGETKERDFGYDRDKDSEGNPKNSNLSYLQSGFTFTMTNILSYIVSLIK